MPEGLLTRRARADLKRIWSYIARQDRGAADRLIARLRHRIELLERFPELSPVRSDIRPGLRMAIVSGYRILYEYREADYTVEIVAVVEPYRDLDRLS